MTGVVSTTVCACQASVDVAVSARLDLVSRQGECWTLGKLDQNLVSVEWGTESQAHARTPQEKNPSVTVCLVQMLNLSVPEPSLLGQ